MRDKKPMEYQKALSQISEIHDHLSRAQVYRGYRAVPVACSGIVALLATAFQHRIVGVGSGTDFVTYWVTVGLIGAFTAGGGIVHNYWVEDSSVARRHTRTVLGQLVPSILAGTAATLFLARAGEPSIVYLPGLWTILYSLGVFASRPYLPKIIGWVGLYYMIAGILLLAVADVRAGLNPWGIGGAFGAGQLFAGWVLYRDVERKEHE